MALTCENVDPVALAALLPHPAADANKYSRGKCLIFAGTERFGGAAVLCTKAAQRMGAGYTQVYTAGCNMDLVRTCAPSAVVGSWSVAVLSRLEGSTAAHPCAYVVGPGFDADDVDVRQVVLAALRTQAPVLMDGGAFGVLGLQQARNLLELRAQEGYATVLTPHAGEAARLAAAAGLADGLQDAALAAALAEAFHALVCLKGPVTYVSDGARTVQVTEGTSALAKAGTGDVLAGMVGALLCQGLAAFDAAVLAVYLHAKAGNLAAAELTDIAVIPDDVIGSIPAAIKALDALA